jgi:hypothetical protein
MAFKLQVKTTQSALEMELGPYPTDKVARQQAELTAQHGFWHKKLFIPKHQIIFIQVVEG